MKLDELARQSSDAARVSVAHLDPSSIGENVRHRSWAPTVAAVGVVALLLGGLYVIARDRDAASPADQALPGVVEIPRLGLAGTPDWTVNTAGSFAELGGDPDRGPSFLYYGDATADDPFANGDLLIAVLVGADTGAVPPAPPDTETVELRGVTATVTSGTDEGLPADATALEWYEIAADGTPARIIVVSRSFGTDELVRIADGLTVDVANGTATPADSLDLDRLAATVGTPFGAYRRSGDGYLVVYGGVDGTDSLTLSTTRGDLGQEVAILRWWTSDVRATTIGGRPGFELGFDESMPALGASLVWSPVDGIVATLAHLGTTRSVDLESLAAGVVEIDDRTWADYRAATLTSSSSDAEFDEIYGQGSGTVGGTVGDTAYTWVLGLQGTDLCFDIQTQRDGSGSCQPRSAVVPPSGSATTIDNGFADTYAEVLIAADPDVEQVVESTGTWTIDRVDADGVAWFVAIGDPAVQPWFDVIVGGEVVATLGAAVETVAETEPALRSNPAAIRAGVDDMEVLVSGTADVGVDWWLGRTGDDLCLVTGGSAQSAHCSLPADVVVFPAVTPERRGELTFVVLRDRPACTEGYEIESAEGGLIVGNGEVDQRRYEVVVGYGTSEGWRLRLDTSAGQTSIELPSPHGTTGWPTSLCGS